MSENVSNTASVLDSSEKKRGLRIMQVWILVTLLFAVLAGSAATYAWFTSNLEASTNSVSISSGDEGLSFRMSSDGASFTTDEEVALASNSPADLELHPVSTYDLVNFVECTGFEDGNATDFALADDGKKYYHGWVYVQADKTGNNADRMGNTVSVYLSDGLLASSTDGKLVKAARIGFKLSKDDAVQGIHYFPLDGEAGSTRSYHPDTTPTQGGYIEGQLLGWENGALAYGEDRSESF